MKLDLPLLEGISHYKYLRNDEVPRQLYTSFGMWITSCQGQLINITYMCRLCRKKGRRPSNFAEHRGARIRERIPGDVWRSPDARRKSAEQSLVGAD